jgi:hypothetical protein
MRIKKYNNFIKESLIYDLIGDEYYYNLKGEESRMILDESTFVPISEEESDEYLPLIKSFIDKEAKESGIKKNKYFFNEKHSDVITWDRTTNKKIERWVYQFSWKSGKVPSFSFCYVYKLPDDFIIIHFWIIGISFSESYLIDTYGGIEQFKKDKIEKESDNLNESFSKFLKDDLYKEWNHDDSEIVPTFSAENDDLVEMEKIEIEKIIKNYLKKFETELMRINKEKYNSHIWFELDNGSILINKYEDEYFYVQVLMPIVIIGYERYCDTRTQVRDFICDSLEGIKKWASENPLKLYYPHVYHSLK